MDIKGTVSVMLSDPSCKDGNVQFKTVPFKPQSDHKCGRYRRFSDSKIVISVIFFINSNEQEMHKSLSQE